MKSTWATIGVLGVIVMFLISLTVFCVVGSVQLMIWMCSAIADISRSRKKVDDETMIEDDPNALTANMEIMLERIKENGDMPYDDLHKGTVKALEDRGLVRVCPSKKDNCTMVKVV